MRGEERVAQPGEQRLAEEPRARARRRRRVRHGDQRRARVALEQRLEQLVGRARRRRRSRRRRRTWSSAESVSRAEPPPRRTHVGDDLVVDRRARRRSTTQRTCSSSSSARQQVELEVLGAAADGGQHLLRVGGGQHEHHVVRRLLERLQQRVRRRRREHVDLVEDVHLRAPGRAERGPGDEVADGVDAVVRGGVELVEVEARCRPRSRRRSRSRRTGSPSTRASQLSALARMRAGRRLARAPGAAEEVGVADPAVAHGVAQGADDVVLAPDLGEAPGPVPAVERLVGHRPATYRRPSRARPRRPDPPLDVAARRSAAHRTTR